MSVTAWMITAGLVDEALVEKRRGLGMFIVKGARSKLLTLEKKRFLEDEWPEINARISALGLSAKDLLKTIGNKNGSKK